VSHTVDHRLRSLVTFEQHNLASTAPLPAAVDRPVDIIVCRNVMMYLRADLADRLAERFFDTLRPGGWLIVGAVETSRLRFRRYQAIVIDGLTFYRRPTSTATSSASIEDADPRMRPRERSAAQPGSRSEPLLPGAADAVRHRRRHDGARNAARPAKRVWLGDHGAADDSRGRADDEPIARARSLADAGRLTDARAVLTGGGDVGSHTTDGLSLVATIAEAEGALDDAAAALRDAVRMAPDDVPLRFRLALLDFQGGNVRAALDGLAIAVAALGDLADDHPLPGYAELTAGRVRSVARHLGAA
jgi:hypothetical protein